jgi:uncharacterized protein YbjT (DUF2867 family)
VILVAGGTGRLGSLVVRGLAQRQIPVRVLTRDPARAGHLAADGVEVTVGDVRDPATLTKAVSGADVVVSAIHGFAGVDGVTPATIDRDGNVHLIDAARDAGSHVVMMSVVGAAADSPLELFRMKYAAEQHLLASGVPCTIVRATAFLELWVELLHKTAARSGRPVVFGRGANPINFVSACDVAAVVERAITDVTTRGSILQIGGPDNISLNQLAAAVQASAGRTSQPRHIPRPALHLIANTIGRIKRDLGRQARAAIAMDQIDLTFDSTALRQAYPDLPLTSLDTCLHPMTPPRPREA